MAELVLRLAAAAGESRASDVAVGFGPFRPELGDCARHLYPTLLALCGTSRIWAEAVQPQLVKHLAFHLSASFDRTRLSCFLLQTAERWGHRTKSLHIGFNAERPSDQSTLDELVADVVKAVPNVESLDISSPCEFDSYPRSWQALIGIKSLRHLHIYDGRVELQYYQDIVTAHPGLDSVSIMINGDTRSDGIARIIHGLQLSSLSLLGTDDFLGSTMAWTNWKGGLQYLTLGRSLPVNSSDAGLSIVRESASTLESLCFVGQGVTILLDIIWAGLALPQLRSIKLFPPESLDWSLNLLDWVGRIDDANVTELTLPPLPGMFVLAAFLSVAIRRRDQNGQNDLGLRRVRNYRLVFEEGFDGLEHLKQQQQDCLAALSSLLAD